MTITCKAAAIASLLLVAGIGEHAALAQSAKQDTRERAVEQYTCKDVMRENGPNRDISIAFLHGFLLGKSGRSTFNIDVLYDQARRFIDYCLDNPHNKAVDVLSKIRG
jgi:hypothetical protein